MQHAPSQVAENLWSILTSDSIKSYATMTTTPVYSECRSHTEMNNNMFNLQHQQSVCMYVYDDYKKL